MFRIRINLRRMRIHISQYVARKFHHRHLHAEANSKHRHAVFPRIPHCGNFSREPARAKAARDEHAVRIREKRCGVSVRHVLCRNHSNLHARIICNSGML